MWNEQASYTMYVTELDFPAGQATCWLFLSTFADANQGPRSGLRFRDREGSGERSSLGRPSRKVPARLERLLRRESKPKKKE